SRAQIKRLRAEGIGTLAALSRSETQNPVIARLQGQARLQLERRETGKPKFEVLPAAPLISDTERRGFQRLPQPDAGDVFFDMEGDPFEAGGLEYLFGIRFSDDGEPRFMPLWAHDRAAERVAFEEL